MFIRAESLVLCQCFTVREVFVAFVAVVVQFSVPLVSLHLRFRVERSHAVWIGAPDALDRLKWRAHLGDKCEVFSMSEYGCL